MAKKAVTKRAGKKRGAKKAGKVLLAAPANVVQIHMVGTNPAVSGMATAPGVTVVGFVKPAGSTVNCQLYTQAGVGAGHAVVAAGHRWSVTFTAMETPAGVDYLFEANLNGTDVTAYITFHT
jgi:hypothetical protein